MTKTTRNDRSGPSLLLVTAQQKANVQLCWERFEALAQAGWPDPRAGGAEIVRTFRDHASDPEVNELRRTTWPFAVRSCVRRNEARW